MKRIFFIIFACAILFAGCGKKDKIDEAEMRKLSSSLIKLASAVESTVRYKKPPEGISDAELLILSTKHDPGILAPFQNYTVKVSQQNRHAVVLVCTKNGRRGLLEDAGCSTPMDKNLWESKSSCKFTMNADDVCKR